MKGNSAPPENTPWKSFHQAVMEQTKISPSKWHHIENCSNWITKHRISINWNRFVFRKRRELRLRSAAIWWLGDLTTCFSLCLGFLKLNLFVFYHFNTVKKTWSDYFCFNIRLFKFCVFLNVIPFLVRSVLWSQPYMKKLFLKPFHTTVFL